METLKAVDEMVKAAYRANDAKLERYAEVAKAAIEVIGVLQAHARYLSAKDCTRLAEDLGNRGLDPDKIVGFLGLIARKEG